MRSVPHLLKPSRDQIIAALTAAIDEGNLPEDYEGFLSDAFEPSVGDVTRALRDANLFGDFTVFAVLERSPDGGTDGGHILIRVPGGPTIASDALELKHLTADRIATGIDGLVAIANSVLDNASRAVMALDHWVSEPDGSR